MREFCHGKFIFDQSEDTNFETFLGEHAPDPLSCLRFTAAFNPGLHMSRKDHRHMFPDMYLKPSRCGLISTLLNDHNN